MTKETKKIVKLVEDEIIRLNQKIDEFHNDDDVVAYIAVKRVLAIIENEVKK